MTEQTVDDLVVRHSLTVRAPQERAFAVFTERMTDWWPLATHSTSENPPVAVVVEPRDGGRWYERSADGTTSEWGRVLSWEPPGRVLLAWELGLDFQHDPSVGTEVEVTFTDLGEEGTRVDLEHRGLEVFGEHAAGLRAQLGAPEGWPAVLAEFGALAA